MVTSENPPKKDSERPDVVQAQPLEDSPVMAAGALVTGGATGAAGYAATNYIVKNKLLPFDTQVAEKTVAEIKGMGLSGGLLATGSAATDGVQFAGGAVKEKVYLNMLKENKLARFTHNIGGRGVLSLVAGIAAGAIGLLAGMALFSRRKPTQNYDFEQARQEAVNRAKDYEKDPLPSDEILLGKREAPTEQQIATVAKFDPRTADILEVSKDLKAAENDPGKQEEILSNWKKRLDERAAKPAETLRQ